MSKEPRPKGYPKLKNYKPSQFMLPTSHYDNKKADRAVTFIENLCHTKGKWAGTPFWLLPWQEQLIRDAITWHDYHQCLCLCGQHFNPGTGGISASKRIGTVD